MFPQVLESYHPTEEAAARAYDVVAVMHGKQLNFPASFAPFGTSPTDEAATRGNEPRKSQHKGVTWDKRAKRWKAQVIIT